MTKKTKRNKRKSRSCVSRMGNRLSKKGGGLCGSKVCPPTTLWDDTKYKKFKLTTTQVRIKDMKMGERYFIETNPDELCQTFETGVFDGDFSSGIYSGGTFKKMRLLYKNPIAKCEKWPGSYTQPKYSDKINPVSGDNDEIGRTGEIRLYHQYLFYTSSQTQQQLIQSKILPKLPLPPDITGNIREFL